MRSPLLQQVLPHIAAILLFLILNSFYFSPQLSGKVVEQSDIIQYLGMAKEVKDYKKETGETSLWTNSMFGGMPTYQINTSKEGNYLKYLERTIYLGFKNPIGVFFAAMLSFYILMVVLGVNPWLSIIGAVVFGFTTNNFLLYETGHETKLKSIAFFPLIIAGMILAYRKELLWGTVLFATGLGLNIMVNHVQMTYYLGLTLVFFGVAQLIYDIRNNNLPSFLKATGLLVVAAGLAVGAAASNLWTTYEYSKDTMRGEPILQADIPDSSNSSETDGLAWDYAMQWSNGALDVFAGFVPGLVGGGTGQAVSKDSEYGKALSKVAQRLPNEIPAPLYWGSLPFTSGPIYFGAVVIFLFFLGLWTVEGPIKWWVGLGTLLTIFLSMGKNAEAINEFFFYYVPLFNKFRTPNSVLGITAFLMPILGILALHQIFTGKTAKKDALMGTYIAGGVTGAIALFFALLGPSFFDFSTPADAGQIQRSLGQVPENIMGNLVAGLMETRQSWMSEDAFRSFFFIAICAGLLWAYLTDKINQTVVIAGIGLIALFDLWTVGRRYFDNENFRTKTNYERNFQKTAADEQILADPQLSFRVFDVTTNPFSSSRASYYHKSLGGYHAAKLQRYQDIIDRHLSQNNQAVINMLNTKYYIVNGQNGQQAQPNPGALGNAWFVDTLIKVQSANEEIDALTDFQPGRAAVVHNDFASYVQGLNLQRGGSIQLSDYKPNELSYTVNIPAEQLAVFSEIWYGPNKGWQAYIDNEPVDHIRVNYILRALKIPAGQHAVVFKFEPQSYQAGVTVSRISSAIILLSLLGTIGYQGYNYIQNLPETPVPKPTTPKPAPKKTTSKTAAAQRKKKKKK